MKKKETGKLIAKALTAITSNLLSAAANSRCALVYHQPKHPEELKKLRKF